MLQLAQLPYAHVEIGADTPEKCVQGLIEAVQVAWEQSDRGIFFDSRVKKKLTFEIVNVERSWSNYLGFSDIYNFTGVNIEYGFKLTGMIRAQFFKSKFPQYRDTTEN